MRSIKNELQYIIFGHESVGEASQLKKAQHFLRTNAEASFSNQKQQQLKSEEAAGLLIFAERENLLYTASIPEIDLIGEGAEQRVYRLDGYNIIKTNAGVFYESWLDYFNSLLIHNYFFSATAYTFLGFKIINDELNAVMQEFIVTSEPTDLTIVKAFLTYNSFFNNQNNDYVNTELGLIFEDLNDENVLSANGILFFIDTIFYLTDDFYKD